MGHPVSFSDDDPLLADVRTVALALPEAVEKLAWGHPTFRTGARGKIFTLLSRPGGTGAQLVFKPDPDERDALLGDGRISVPAYWGPSGWLGLDLLAAPVDLDEVAELVESSYRLVALRRQVALLEPGPGG